MTPYDLEFAIGDQPFDGTDVLLSLAVIDRAGSIEEAFRVLKAAESLRAFVGGVRTPFSAEVSDWNRSVPIGQSVVVTPGGSEFPFVARTTSPAFDTPGGPMILIDSEIHAIPLTSVRPVAFTETAGGQL